MRMHCESSPRRGVTLTETLVAIFICGIGLIALMTLFPLGALNMAQALRDDRASQSGPNGAAVLRMLWRYHLNSGQNDPFFDNLLQTRQPVYLDPVGCLNSPGGRVGNSFIQRTNIPSLQGKPIAETVRWCTMLDDLAFDKNGTPENFSGLVSRESRFSWAWMIRQLNQQGPPRVLQYAVVVYQNRPVPGNPAVEERSAQASPVGDKTIRVSHGGGASKPKIRKGGWVLDGNNGYFYRAVSIRDLAPNTMEIEFQTPFRGGAAPTQVVFMDNVVEVFERGTLE